MRFDADKYFAAGGPANVSQAQRDAGNYPKQHERVAGLPIAIENPKGSVRVRKDSGPATMAADYGQIIGSAKDKDRMDVDTYVGPHKDSDKVFVVNQQHPHSKVFNEHKVMLGYKDRSHALHDYVHSFSDGLGHKRVQSIVEMDKSQLKDWLRKGRHTVPLKKAGGGEVEAQQVPYSGGEYPGEVETPAWYDKATQAVGRVIAEPFTERPRDRLKARMDEGTLAALDQAGVEIPRDAVDIINTDQGPVPVDMEGKPLAWERMSPVKYAINQMGNVVGGVAAPVKEAGMLLGAGPVRRAKTAASEAETAAIKASERAAIAAKEAEAVDSSRLVEDAVNLSKSAEEETQGAKYVTRQDGPFYRVSKEKPGGSEEGAAVQDGLRQEAGADRTNLIEPKGTVRDVVPTRDEEASLDNLIKDSNQNQVKKILDQYIKDNFNPEGLTDLQMPKSSLAKQSAIGRAFQLAVEGKAPYKNAVFNAYKKQMPEVVQMSGAKNYDELMNAAYDQLMKETSAQFDLLPHDMSFYKNDEGAYKNSREMLHDVHNRNHLYVFQGGNEHELLNKVDSKTGLNANEKFRAVHDAFGHAVEGNQFGPAGEEIAWGVHQQSYSPLARIAMTSETRGQNSFVNYTPINAALKEEINNIDQRIARAKQYGWTEDISDLEAEKKNLYDAFSYAPQNAVMLPPEFLSPRYAGGMPDYIQKIIRPSDGSEFSSILTHYSHNPDLRTTDPRMYGTGIQGDEAKRLRDAPGGVKERSYFYLGDPANVTPEENLGPYAYSAESKRLYNMVEDPEKLGLLSRVSNKRPYSSNFNPGAIDHAQIANDIERLAKEYGYEGVANPNHAYPMAVVFQPKDVAPFVKFRGKEPSEFTPQDWGDFGRAYGVDKLGPADEGEWLKNLGVIKTKSGREVTIPGGIDSTDPFTYYDLLHLKSQAINPNDLSPVEHQAIHDRMVAALQPSNGSPSDTQIANQMLFGLISPNQPLTPNELALQRVMIKEGSKDLEKMGQMIPYKYTGDIPGIKDRQDLSRYITKMYGLQAAPEGLGVSGSANYTDLAEFAQKMKDRPDFFRFNPNDPSMSGMSDSEKWATHVSRVLNEVRGLKAKTASLGSVWQSPATASISAIDRHMATKFRGEMFPSREVRKQWERETIDSFNEKKNKNVKTINQMLKTPGGRGHFVESALQYVNNLPEAVLRDARTGEYNPSVPVGLRNVNWVGAEPKKVQMIEGPYVRALEANQAEATKAGQSLFANQWMLWDRIRNRLEPHEILFPGLERLPRMNLEQMKKVSKTHSDAGYMAAEGESRPVDIPSRMGYFAFPLAAGALASEAIRQNESSQEKKMAKGGSVGHPSSHIALVNDLRQTAKAHGFQKPGVAHLMKKMGIPSDRAATYASNVLNDPQLHHKINPDAERFLITLHGAMKHTAAQKHMGDLRRHLRNRAIYGNS